MVSDVTRLGLRVANIGGVINRQRRNSSRVEQRSTSVSKH